MGKKLVNECDQCHAIQREANHWFKAKILLSGECVLTNMGMRSDVVDPDDSETAFLCGEECAFKYLGEYISKSKVPVSNRGEI